ncbi:MAG: type I-C CRISPR-associated protein Cas8c/Csd1 [Oscillibacter sp.]|nr:type I-C CRISPR-associated protein Cas8c/Csd1 [Oscillibacter sp.]
MILQALNKHYEDLVKREKIARLGWAKAKISYALCIDGDGGLEQVVSLLSDAEPKKKPQPRQFDLPAPAKRTVGIASNFLWDNSAYLLGADNKGKPERSAKCFRACAAFHHELLDGLESDGAKAILRFFDNWNPAQASEHPALREEWANIVAGANLIFRVNGAYPYKDEAIQAAWQRYYNTESGEKQQCLITGQPDVIEAVHPSLKGVDGAQSSGAALVSFNAPAFCSYGKEQNFNAPVGKSAAFAYTAALNYLLADREHAQKIGDATVVCWAEGAEPQYQGLFLDVTGGGSSLGLTDNDLYAAVKLLAQGKPVEELKLDPQRPFYILGLSPNAARLSVRFFYRDAFGRLMKNVNDHNERMKIIRPAYDKFETIPLWHMLRETVNPNARDKTPSPVMAGATARAIFTGTPYPVSLLENAVLRIRAEREVTRGRAAIIKAFYLRSPHEGCPEEVLQVSLNENSTNEAYALGRLFSLYEAVQLAASPGIKATIKDKYFNAASATPAMVFPVLDNLCQKRLRQLEPGQRIWYEKQILKVAEILGDAYPARLDLPRQGSFDLGYYHQTQKRYEKKEEA